MHLGAGARRQGAELPEAGPRLELPRPLRRARRDPARPRHDLPARPGLPLSLLPRPDDLRGRGADGRGDPPQRHVEGDRRRLRRPAHVQPLRQAGDRHPERLLLRRQPRRSTPRASAARSRPTARTRSSSARSASPRPPRATSTRPSTAPRARSCRSSSSSRTTATASRCPKSDQTANPYVSDNFSGFLNLQDHPLRRPGRLRLLPRDARGGRRSSATGAGCAIVHAPCVRIHSHSNSDRHELYRSPEELAAARAADPLPRFRAHAHRERAPLRGGDRRDRGAEPADLRGGGRPRAQGRPDPTPASIFDFVVPEPWTPERLAGGTARRHGRSDDARPGDQPDAEGGVPPATRTPTSGARTSPTATRAASSTSPRACSRSSAPQRVFNGPIAEDYILGTADGFSRLSDGRSGSSSRARSSPTTSGRPPSRWSRCRTSTGGRTGSSSRTSPCASPPAATSAAASTTRRTSRAGSRRCPASAIVVPAFADDAAGLLRTAIRSRGITLYLEPKFLYNNPMARATVPGGVRRAVREGARAPRGDGPDDRRLRNAGPLRARGRRRRSRRRGRASRSSTCARSSRSTSRPSLASVRKTSRVLVAHEDKVHGGFGGEIVSQIQESVFPYLDAPIGRVGSTFTPVGFNRILERAILPNPRRSSPPRGRSSPTNSPFPAFAPPLCNPTPPFTRLLHRRPAYKPVNERS